MCRYLAEACPDYKLNGFCVLGNECPFAHGVFEINLHPSKYRTQVCGFASFTAMVWSCALTPPFSTPASTPVSMQMCTEAGNCKRKICFFAHTEQQLRQPDYSYGYKNVNEAVSPLPCLEPRVIYVLHHTCLIQGPAVPVYMTAAHELATCCAGVREGGHPCQPQDESADASCACRRHPRTTRAPPVSVSGALPADRAHTLLRAPMAHRTNPSL